MRRLLLAALLLPVLAGAAAAQSWDRGEGTIATVNGQLNGCNISANAADMQGWGGGSIVMTIANLTNRPVTVTWRAELSGAGVNRVETSQPLALGARTVMGLVPVMSRMGGANLSGSRLAIVITDCRPQ